MMGKYKIQIVLITSFLVSWIYLLPRVAGHITSGDSGELALAGSTLGIAHSPGYPVFVCVQFIISKLIFFGNLAFRQNAACCLMACLTIVILGALIIYLTDIWWMGSISLLLLFSPIFKSQAAVTEVFMMTGFWGALLLYVLVRTVHQREGVYLLAFLMGISTAIHQSLFLYFPVLIIYYLQTRDKTFQEHMKDTGPVVLFFILGWSVNFYPYVRSFADPVLDWEDPEEWNRWWGLLSRARYGFFQLAQGSTHRVINLQAIQNSLIHTKMVFVDNLGWVGFGAVFLSSLVALSQRKYRRILMLGWLAVIFVGPFFFWMAAVGVDHQTGILDRFSILVLIPAIMILGMGLSIIWNTKIKLYRSVLVGLALFFILEMGVITPKKIEASMRWDLSIRESAINLLKLIPSESVLLSDRADETEFSVAFLLMAEQRKSGVRFVDCNAGVTKSIYGEDYYRIWGPPRLQIREEKELELIKKSKIPVFYATVDPQMLDIFRFSWGFIYGENKRSREIDPIHQISVR